MVTKELSEAAVEFNCILEYTSEELKNKIPQIFLDFLKNIQSQTYKFEYDKTKKLNEQNLKSQTRGLIALVYQDYICNESEKSEYLRKAKKITIQKEEDKRNLYNPDDIFKNRNRIIPEKTQTFEEIRMTLVQEEKWYQKILNLIKNLFHKN